MYWLNRWSSCIKSPVVAYGSVNSVFASSKWVTKCCFICHICMSSHMYVVTYVCRHICMSSHVYVVTYVCRHICMSSHMYVGVSLPIMDGHGCDLERRRHEFLLICTCVPICPRVVDKSGFPNSELLAQHLRKLRQRRFSKFRRRRCKEVKRMESV
jgi:hypothetical protein